MIFTGRSVDALDEMRGTSRGAGAGAGGVVRSVVDGGRRDASAVAIAAGWFSSLRRPGKKSKKNLNQKQAKSAWDLSVLSTTVSRRARDYRNYSDYAD
ncbi:cytohesin-1-like isoform 1 protein [Lasius niger]|uniref:Cytohesin-1-like isoform 1 protein n=1 Tax=Lasius niger TaxID=67767 RepID=A0A0J7KL36_LASNI|nr:cytohesin-1-like isoform 1 protein [Lasius niger]